MTQQHRDGLKVAVPVGVDDLGKIFCQISVANVILCCLANWLTSFYILVGYMSYLLAIGGWMKNQRVLLVLLYPGRHQ